MSSDIPAHARTAVKERDRNRCVRCGGFAGNGQWHHRRSRSVPGEHRHCPCNGIWLCPACHGWVHNNPASATRDGLIVSRYEYEPAVHPVLTAWGQRLLFCDATYTHFSD